MGGGSHKPNLKWWPTRISALEAAAGEDIFIGGRAGVGQAENEGTAWRDCARDDFQSHARNAAKSCIK